MNDATQNPGGEKPASAAASSSVAAPPPNPLLPRRCLHCGYNLLGTVDDGTCPECGGAYEPGAYMWTPVTRAHGWAQAVPVVIAGSVPAALTAMFTLVSLRSAMPAWMFVIAVGMLAVMVFAVYRQFSEDKPREYFVVTRDGVRFRMAYDNQVTQEQFKSWFEIDRVVPARYDRTATIVFVSAPVEGERPLVEPGATCPFFQSAEEVMAFTALVEQRLHEHRRKHPRPGSAAVTTSP